MSLDFFIHYRYGGGDTLDLGSTTGVGDDQLPALDTMVLGEAVCGLVAETRTARAYSEVDRSEDDRLTLATALGSRAYASFPLLDGSELLGTLSFGSRTRPALTEPELEALRLGADLLAAALAHHRDHEALDRARRELRALAGQAQQLSEETVRLRREVDQLSTAITTRAQISQVKGMLMMRFDLGEEAAWRLLVRLSQSTNRKLRDVAAALGDHLTNQVELPEDLRRQLDGD